MVDATRFERSLTAAHSRLAAGDANEAKVRLDEALARGTGRRTTSSHPSYGSGLTPLRLEELRLSAAEDQPRRCYSAARLEAVGELERLTVEFPLRERSRHKLMSSYRDGRQADAVRSFQTYRTHLAEEVGLEPSGELVGLQRIIVILTRASTRNLDSSAAGLPPRRAARRGSLRRRAPGDPALCGREVAVKVIRPVSPIDPRSSAGSRTRRSSSPASSTPTSCRSTTSGASRVARTS